MKLASVPAPVWYLAGAAVAGVVLYQLAKRGAAAVGQAVNPTSRDNVAYSGVNAVGAAVSGDDSFSLGAWLYNVTHSEDEKLMSDQPANYNANARTGVPVPR